MNEQGKVKLHQALNLLQQALSSISHQPAIALLDRTLEIIEVEEDLPSPKTSPVGIPLKHSLFIVHCSLK